jgi:ABC-type antimicrobial peptide transport system permease subunit
VGVVGDVANGDGGVLPRPAVYLPFSQHARSSMALLVRTQGDPLRVADPVRSAVWGIDSGQPIDDVRTFKQALRHDWAPLRSVVTLFVAFALFALLMAAVGIYGVTSYSVSQRTGEVCIRMALGAGTGSVRRMMLGEGITLIGLSTAVGLAGAWALSRLLASLVVGISSTDPLTFLGVPVLVAVVGLAANYVPVRRVLRADLMTALRLE